MGQTIPAVTKNLLIINGLFYLATIIFESKGIDLRVILGAFYPGSPNFHVWQLITHMFMHGDFTHILFNMFALYMFGSAVENTIGSKEFIKLYLLAGLGGFALYNLINYYDVLTIIGHLKTLGIDPQQVYDLSLLASDRTLVSGQYVNQVDAIHLRDAYITPMVGASGAIYGLLIAFAVLYPEAKLALIFFPVGVKAKYFIPAIIALELFLGFKNYEWNNIAHFAHLGGALIGFLLIRQWKKNLYRRN